MFGINLGLTKTIKDTTQTVSKTLSGVNEYASAFEVTGKMARTAMEFELKKQELKNEAKLAKLANQECKETEDGDWEFFDKES